MAEPRVCWRCSGTGMVYESAATYALPVWCYECKGRGVYWVEVLRLDARHRQVQGGQ